jgi:hypothetical protein
MTATVPYKVAAADGQAAARKAPAEQGIPAAARIDN